VKCLKASICVGMEAVAGMHAALKRREWSQLNKEARAYQRALASIQEYLQRQGIAAVDEEARCNLVQLEVKQRLLARELSQSMATVREDIEQLGRAARRLSVEVRPANLE